MLLKKEKLLLISKHSKEHWLTLKNLLILSQRLTDYIQIERKLVPKLMELRNKLMLKMLKLKELKMKWTKLENKEKILNSS